eukprot:289322-Amorphochlora_amoeboformis.AAC.1
MPRMVIFPPSLNLAHHLTLTNPISSGVSPDPNFNFLFLVRVDGEEFEGVCTRIPLGLARRSTLYNEFIHE